jgi:hypothetical protein
MNNQTLVYQTRNDLFIHKDIVEHKHLTIEDKAIYIHLNLLNQKGKVAISTSDLRKVIQGKNPFTALEHLLKYNIIESYYRTKDRFLVYLSDSNEDLIDE